MVRRDRLADPGGLEQRDRARSRLALLHAAAHRDAALRGSALRPAAATARPARREHRVGIFVGAIAVLSLGGVLSLWQLLVLVAGYGASEAVFGPAYGAIVPELVDHDVLTQANSLNQLNRPLALRLAGPALGGLLVSGLGVGWALALDAGTFAVSAAILSRMAVPRSALAAVETSVRAVLREGGRGARGGPACAVALGREGADAIGTLATWGCVQALVAGARARRSGRRRRDARVRLAAGGVGAVVAAPHDRLAGSPRRPVVVLFLVLAGKVAAVGLFGFATSAATAMVASS